MTSPTARLADIGVSIWLDDLSRDRLTSGSLAGLMATHHVVGVTSNPTIFASAVGAGSDYVEGIRRSAADGESAEEAVFRLMIADVQASCDIMRPVFDATHGLDGRVSLEVSPLLARDTQGTIDQALSLWKRVDRPNLMVKIPATLESLPAVTEVVSQGVSVNVTLIFSLERYDRVIDAYCAGIEKAHANGVDISRIHSVASFFVSRVDSAVDAILDTTGSDEAKALRSEAGLANARLAYELFETRHHEERVQELMALGMNKQRPLWASTGVKDPALPEDLYVSGLAVAETVNTMPEKTLLATETSGQVDGDQVRPNYEHAHSVFAALEEIGVNMTQVTDTLEREGVEKFVVSWQELLTTVQSAMEATE